MDDTLLAPEEEIEIKKEIIYSIIEGEYKTVDEVNIKETEKEIISEREEIKEKIYNYGQIKNIASDLEMISLRLVEEGIKEIEEIQKKQIKEKTDLQNKLLKFQNILEEMNSLMSEVEFTKDEIIEPEDSTADIPIDII